MAERAPVYIHAAAALGPCGDSTAAERTRLAADPAPFELEELVKRVVGVPLRQASHLVELAAVGSQLCLKRLPYAAPENTAVYVGTGLAEVRKTGALFHQVFPPGPGMASPFDFINAANNMAAFYAAKLGNFRARNLTVTQEEFSFEWALKLALDDLHAGSFRHALVGGVDENPQPRATHLRRIRLRGDQPMGEGAGFLYLSREREHARGRLLAVRTLPAGAGLTDALAATVRELRRSDEDVELLPGFRLEPIEIAALGRALPQARIDRLPRDLRLLSHRRRLRAGRPVRFPRRALAIHINRDLHDHAMLIAARIGPDSSSATLL
ncbi:MAG: hypothetical protein MZW92_50785 [Comamonadaceae bacterium]|nr:hypothetical protein [Comamonadaceae bacterium]